MLMALRLFIAAVVALFGASIANAAETILTVTGAVDGESVAFSRADLDSMPRTTFRTSTIWTEGEQEFSGVALADLMAAVGAKGKRIKATALNDYSVEIPMEDVAKPGPIVALWHNGREMSVRKKGPLWILYPYDSDPDFQKETIYSRSIWQLNRLEVIQ